MPLTDQEKLALSHFLNNIDGTVLCRLAAAVTNGSLNPQSREDAYNCVMLHTDSLYQVLNLKRVNTAVLLKYLHLLNEYVPGTATKEEMLQRLYHKWNFPFPSKNIHYAPPPAPLTGMPSNYHSVAPVQLPTNPYAPAIMSANLPHTSLNHCDHQFEMMVAASRMTNMNYDPLSQMVRSKQVLKEMNTMAFNEYIVGFAQTFYNLLNNPSDCSQWFHGFNDTHFFGECKLKVMIKGASEDLEHEGEGINEVLSVLSDLKKEHQLYFSPNLKEQGVRSKQDSHGLISAAVCGTLHQRTGPVGVFEQCFVLSADPFAKESYKILESVLIMRSSNAVSSITEFMLTSGKKHDHNLALEDGSSTRSNVMSNNSIVSAPILSIKD